MESKFRKLDAEEVLMVNKDLGNQIWIQPSPSSCYYFTPTDLALIFMKRLSGRHDAIPQEVLHQLFTDGITCEALQYQAKGWKKGKFRAKVTVEFCADEPEASVSNCVCESGSPLDDVRQMIQQENP